MRLPAYQDIQRVYPEQYGNIPFESLRNNPQFQRKSAGSYLDLLSTGYKLKDDDSVIAGYNAGPGVRKTGIKNRSYVDKVRRAMGNPTLRRFNAPAQ